MVSSDRHRIATCERSLQVLPGSLKGKGRLNAGQLKRDDADEKFGSTRRSSAHGLAATSPPSPGWQGRKGALEALSFGMACLCRVETECRQTHNGDNDVPMSRKFNISGQMHQLAGSLGEGTCR